MQGKKRRAALRRMAKRFDLIGEWKETDRNKSCWLIMKKKQSVIFDKDEKHSDKIETCFCSVSDGVLMYSRVSPPLRVPRSREEVITTISVQIKTPSSFQITSLKNNTSNTVIYELSDKSLHLRVIVT